MLTKTDLSQIRKVVKDEVRVETRKIVREETKEIILTETRKIVQGELTPIKKDIRTIKGDIASIRKDVKVIVSFFDSEYLELRKRVERIEDYLKLSPQATTS